MIRTIIVDDEILARLGMRTFLDTQDDICIESDFGFAQDALDYLIKNNGTDIVITDIEMMEMNGLEFIKKLKEGHLASGIIIISCHDNFEYAREAIRLGADSYILKQEINEALLISEIKKLYEEKVVKSSRRINRSMNPITSDRVDEDSIYAVGVLKLEQGYDEYGKAISTPVDESMLEHLIDSVIAKYQMGTLFVPYNKDMFIIFQIPRKVSKEEREGIIHDVCYDLQQNIKIYVNKTLVVGISDTFTNINEVPNYYQEAIKAAELRFYDGSRRNHWYRFEKRDMVEIPELVFTADGFLDEEGVEKFREELHGYIMHCKRNKIEVDKVKQLLIKKLNILIWSVLHNYSFSDELIKKWDDKYQYFEMIDKTDHSEILEQNLIAMMQRCQTDLLTELKNDEFNTVLQFVNSNIGSKISLEEMAELNCMSTASFCKKFKERTGMTLIQYINLKKIDQVKTLLKGNQYSLGQIAEIAGFCNENYMIRVFKKVTGQTIKAYKKGKSNIES